jgi:hypothetical protein
MSLYASIQLYIIESQRQICLRNSKVIPEYDEVISQHPEIHVHEINKKLGVI